MEDLPEFFVEPYLMELYESDPYRGQPGEFMEPAGQVPIAPRLEDWLEERNAPPLAIPAKVIGGTSQVHFGTEPSPWPAQEERASGAPAASSRGPAQTEGRRQERRRCRGRRRGGASEGWPTGGCSLSFSSRADSRS